MTTEEELANARQVVASLTERLYAVSAERADLFRDNCLLKLVRWERDRLVKVCTPLLGWGDGVPRPQERKDRIGDLAKVMRDISESEPKPPKEKK